ncbi:MAG: flavodoxin family protein, partial [Desulfuromonadales bacterium]|nr:flavodoxin family protein [Desulfuromonadales bacterium]NIR32976.1 flavodoxin family protein [Desulfuromonadales bacterium]NIS40534.1 flavodoxin family protein [Desulfuromonadales bacterium]
MKIVCLYGSPRRKGNSAIVARHFLAHASARGGEVQSFYLNGLEARGCQACNAC